MREDMSNETTGAKSLKEIIRDKEFSIPMYQRNYKWNSNVAEKLVNDIISSYKNGNEKSLGLITLYDKNNENKKYQVIDGQQRFTTLAILLNLLESKENITLTFERDKEDQKRSNAVNGTLEGDVECTDVNRIKRNREKMHELIKKSKIPKCELANYVLDNVIMLCSIVKTLPVEEFMNLNAYKTAFSICDHVRANLIALNSFHKDKLEEENVAPILARCLSNHSYKTAVAILYNELQKKLYEVEKKEGTYKSVYDLLKKPDIVIEPVQESRINILFGAMLKPGAQNYDSGEITENLDFWIKMLQKLAFVNKLLDELKEEFDRGEYHSFKQIDDYQKLTKKSFIREVFDGIDNDWDSQTLAKEIQKYTNIDSVIISCLQQDSKKLANRYLEAFVYSDVNSETLKQADNENWKKVALAQMPLEDVVEEISGCGRYIIDRYEIEHREDLNVNIDIPPVLDLEDRENIKFGGSLDLQESDEISVGELFEYNIKIPVIQRDYCMGARITGENDFLSFLLDGYKKKLSAGTVLLSVSEENDNNKTLYIFDGQQRTFTLYNILKYCGCEMKEYNFVGRESENRDIESNSHGSPYSKVAVYNLIQILKDKIEDGKKKDFAEYIKNNVFLKVKIVDNVYGAEQFFMDINGGVALNFGGSLDLQESDEISVGELFKYNIKIPVIQRDYCMEARITGENDFLSFLLDGYKKKLSASTVLLSVSEENDNNKTLYIFDGQQRTFTLYNILKYCGCEMKEYNFVGRESEIKDSESNSYGSPYSKAAVDNLIQKLKDKQITDKKGFAEYIKENVFLKVKIVDNVSGAEQFFMDINGGVALEKYEIYKAMLCDRLSKLKRTDVVKKIENKWLDFFYKYRKDYLGVSDIAKNENDEEELLEIRFIEYVCRFVYRMNHYGAIYKDIWVNNESDKFHNGAIYEDIWVNNKLDKFHKNDDQKYGKSDICNESKELPTFDEIESKGDLVAKLSYISDLDKNDIENVDTIMEAITSYEIKKGEDCSINVKESWLWLQTTSVYDGVVIIRLECEENKQTILDKMNYYVMQFIWSLTEDNRKILEKYYRYKDIKGLVKIYDDDQIMRDIILSVLRKDIHGDAYPYQIFCSNTNYFYCGYNHNDNDGMRKDQIVARKNMENKYVKEIPAYYFNKLESKLKYVDNFVRLQYLQEKACSKNNAPLFFALVKNGFGGQIKYEDGNENSNTNTNICLLSGDLGEYKRRCRYRTEAYCLQYNLPTKIDENQ